MKNISNLKIIVYFNTQAIQNKMWWWYEHIKRMQEYKQLKLLIHSAPTGKREIGCWKHSGYMLWKDQQLWEYRNRISIKTWKAQEYKFVFSIQSPQVCTLHEGVLHYKVLNIHFTNNQLMPVICNSIRRLIPTWVFNEESFKNNKIVCLR